MKYDLAAARVESGSGKYDSNRDVGRMTLGDA